MYWNFYIVRYKFAKALVTPSYDVGYDITIVILWSYWKRWVCDASVMSVKSYDIVRQSNDSRTMTYDMTMIAWWEAES